MKIWDVLTEDIEKKMEMDESWKKNVVAGALAASTLFGANAQSNKQVHPTSISVPQTKSMDVSILANWNDYVEWLKKNGLSGNKKMNNIAFSKKTMEEYNKENPNSKLTYDMVKPIQTQIKKYRNSVIDYAKSGKPVNFSFKPKSDYSNFMPWVLGTGEDGINGEFTSQFIFPKKYLRNLNTNTLVDLGYASNP